MKKGSIALLVAAAVSLTACQQADPLTVAQVDLQTDEQKRDYALGANMGRFVNQRLEERAELGVNYDKKIIVQSFVAALQGQSQMDEEQVREILMAAEKSFQEKQQQAIAEAGEKAQKEGHDFLVENGKREGVVTTDSGLQYEVLVAGEGKKPSAEDTVKVHYVGTLLNGEEFDSSVARGEPAVFPLNRVISGWTEGVQLMGEGSKYKFYIPAELAYGERATGSIPANSTLVFEVELLQVMPAKEAE